MEPTSTALRRFLKGDEHALGISLLKKMTAAPARAQERHAQQGADGGAGNHGSADRLAAQAKPLDRRPTAAGATGAAARGFHRNAG